MASGINSPTSGQAAGPLGVATGLLAQAIGREPSADERAILARTLDLYRAGWGREADAEWMSLAIAVLALSRGLADSAVAEARQVAREIDTASRNAIALTKQAGADTVDQIAAAADKAGIQIAAAAAERTWRWRWRTWAAAALSVSAMAALGYALAALAGADLMTWAWWREWAVLTALLPLAGALIGVAAMLALPELWTRAAKK